MNILYASLIVFFFSSLSTAMPSFKKRLPISEDEAQAVISELLGAPIQNLDMSKVEKIKRGKRGYTITVALDKPVKFTLDNLCYKEQTYLTWSSFFRKDGSRYKSKGFKHFGAFPNKAGKPCVEKMGWTELSVPKDIEIKPYQLLLFAVKVKEWARTVSKEGFCGNLYGESIEHMCENWNDFRVSNLYFISVRFVPDKAVSPSGPVKGKINVNIMTSWASGFELEFEQTATDLKIGKFSIRYYVI